MFVVDIARAVGEKIDVRTMLVTNIIFGAGRPKSYCSSTLTR
jgi:hypothetical protein